VNPRARGPRPIALNVQLLRTLRIAPETSTKVVPGEPPSIDSTVDREYPVRAPAGFPVSPEGLPKGTRAPIEGMRRLGSLFEEFACEA
jgi:hypothetical protein